MIAVLLMSAQACAAGADSGGSEARPVPWSYISLQAEHLAGRITAEIRLLPRDAASEIPRFLQSPRGVPVDPSGSDLLMLSARIVIEVVGRQAVKINSDVWVDPLTGAPLYLVRTRLGVDDYYQRFRFTREGVFRRQREPASAGEAALPAECWTKVGEHFYPYPPNAAGCHTIAETSALAYLLAAAVLRETAEADPLCVFHKRQLHRVRVHPDTSGAVAFDFVEKKADSENRRAGFMPVRKLRIESQPIGSYRGDVEDFFKDGTLVYLSSDGRLPLMVSCEMPLIGRVEMKLREVHLK